MPDIKWIKLTTEMFDDEKVRIIESMPEADTILVLWIRLICMAGKTNDGGNIYLTPEIPYTTEQLAAIFNRPHNTVKLALEVFMRLQMVTLQYNGTLFLPAFERHQNIVGMEKIREDTRKRVAAFRAKPKLTPLLTDGVTLGNVTVTQQNRIDKSRLDQKKSIELPVWLNKETWDTFLEMRKTIKATPTPRAVSLIFKELERFKNAGDDPNEILNQSIMNNWKGVFALKGGNRNGQNAAYRGNPSQKPSGAFSGLE